MCSPIAQPANGAIHLIGAASEADAARNSQIYIGLGLAAVVELVIRVVAH